VSPLHGGAKTICARASQAQFNAIDKNKAPKGAQKGIFSIKNQH
jgi:hypothetical protein